MTQISNYLLLIRVYPRKSVANYCFAGGLLHSVVGSGSRRASVIATPDNSRLVDEI